MVARIASYSAPGLSADEALTFFRDRVLPDLRRVSGFEEALLLLSEESDEVVALTLWDSEESMRSAEAKSAPHRAERDAIGGQKRDAQVYRVADRAGRAE